MRDELYAAFRSLRTSPTFTAVALVVLALGIGAGTAIFSIVDAVVLRALPFDEHDRLAVVLEHDTRRPTTFGGGTTTAQAYLDWRRLQESFEGLAAVAGWSFRVKTDAGEPSNAQAYRVTHEFFRILRVSPMLGRSFTADDEIDGRNHIVILGYGYWQRRFGGAGDIVGKAVELNEEPWEIVGVMPRGFEYPVASEKPTEMYTPIPWRAQDKTRGKGQNYNYTAIGRLKAGVSLVQAQDQMTRVAEGLDRQYPDWSPGRTVRLLPLQEHIVGRVKSWLLMLLGAVTLVLLIACANVANLMLARATARSREMGIRAALGAGRWRLVRGLLVEGVVLALAGAALGVVLAYAAVHGIRAWLPAGLPRVASIGIDLRVLAASIAAATLTGLASGIVPAMQSSRPDLTTALKDGGRSATAGRHSHRLRSALVIAEVAMAVVLLVAAGLFMASFATLTRIDPGFDYHRVLYLNVGIQWEPAKEKFEEAAKRGGPYVQQMVEAVAHVPGVEAVSAVSGGVPLTGGWSRDSIELPGRGELKDRDDSIDRRGVSANYLTLLRVPLIRGRHLAETDTATSQPVAVINQIAATLYWPNQDPIGQHFKMSGKDFVVVGIAGNIRHLGPESPLRQETYVPFAQESSVGASLVIRTTDDPRRVLPAVKAAIWSVNREQRLSGDVFTLEGYMDRLIAQRRFNMVLLALFGVLGLVIAAVGIYGVMAYSVEQRTSEIGVRMALGATAGSVVVMILGRAATLIVFGIAIGGAGAWYLSAGVKSFLFQVEPNNPVVFAAALAVLTLAGLLASAIPARRASSVDPLIALRHE